MAASPPPPTSPNATRPLSSLRGPRSSSRMSNGRSGEKESRVSDEDGKTSVKVAVRVRPPLKPTDPGFDLIPQRFQRSMVNVTSPSGLSVDSPQGRKLFVFDRVFGEDVQQDGVWDYISQSVDAFMQGYNVSVMAYGQSGAGKSFTMGTSGPEEQADSGLMGVVPRAAAALFDKLSPAAGGMRNGTSGIKAPSRFSMSSVPAFAGSRNSVAEKQWQMKATYVEIYNEQLRDLLIPDSVPNGERGAVTIREDTKGRILLTGLHQVNINSIDDLLDALNFGSSIRQTDATAINAKSSRSHAVFSLNLVQNKNKYAEKSAREKRHSMPADALLGGESFVTVDSKLHFVDLAGSERMKNTGASGERAKEGISINAGLASLGKVISQLSTRAGSHVSYRDSKLTRLLQDSLGGNAITYMIACVNPAEFHISETLNTIQYAQRARAIQSKPKIQQVDSDGDKLALIERLRAEINFLRDQLRSAERPNRNSGVPEREEGFHEKEIELQNHLLDIQENYNALSQRHAKLISELGKAQNGATEDAGVLAGTPGESAVDRIQRSTSFSDAVEQVVLEYEKTIQTLEGLLSNTRSNLSASESKLLERETKCAYVDAVNQQLQSRLSRLIDRESGNERILRDLEAKLDGRNDGEQRTTASLVELRKELTRLRENESTSEEYISTLEERLAEADQDGELMQREIARLEHVIDRQRSVGKLDSLLYELDKKTTPVVDGVAETEAETTPDTEDKQAVSEATYKVAVKTPLPEINEADFDEEDSEAKPAINEEPPQTPAQSKFVEEKLETVNQELFDLRVEHESTVHDYTMLSAKYEEALRTLAALEQKVEDETQPRSPTAFLSMARVRELKDAGNASSSRSLSSELSSAGESPTASEHFDATPTTTAPTTAAPDDDEDRSDGKLVAEVADLQKLLEAKDQALEELIEEHAGLAETHQDALDQVEELKAEVQKAKMSNPPSPPAQFVRRKSSQNLMTVDRAHRSLAALGNLAAENFEQNPDVKESFELHIGSIMHELHQRSERVQALEVELSSVKREMDSKMTIISGLTRERSSLKISSPVDMNTFSSMRDQILKHEQELKSIQEESGARESELNKQIAALSTTSANGSDDTNELSVKVTQLQGELNTWEGKHQAALESMQSSESHLKDTIAELETTLTKVEETRVAKGVELEAQEYAFNLERQKNAEYIDSLTSDLSTQKATAERHGARVAELEQAHAAAQEELTKATKFRDETQTQLDEHKEQIGSLQKKLEEHQQAVESHKHDFVALHESHSVELDQVRAEATQQAEADAEARIEDLSSQHKEEMSGLYAKTKELENRLGEHRSALDQHKQRADEQLEQEKSAHSRTASNASGEITAAQSRLQSLEEAQANAQAALDRARAQLEEMNTSKSELNTELEAVREKEQRASRLVEELEGELASSFERSQQATSRLSLMQNSKEQELADARSDTQKAREELNEMKSRLERYEQAQRGSMSVSTPEPGERSNSLTNGRKNSNVPSAPVSPPPAIPLPPLPTGSPPPTSPQKDLAEKRAEEQENRIRTIEKHLFAEKQLTATLEEALVDLETQGKKLKADMESWKKKAWDYEDELTALRKERNANRHSLQAVEEERSARREAEAARAQLEERMAALNKKKKKSTLNCF